jgi:hypothetical protein
MKAYTLFKKVGIMVKTKRTIFSCLLIVAVLLSFSTMATASVTRLGSQFSEARKIAANTPAMFGYHAKWEIVQETVLYNLSDEIVGYCFDMENASTDSDSPATTYVIVNANETDFPIFLFGADGRSAYYGRDFDKALYFGTLDFYIEADKAIIDPRTDEEVSIADLSIFAKTPTLAIAENYSAVRQEYLNGNSTNTAPVTDTGAISNGLNFQWRKGCAPTTIAMMIATRYPQLASNSEALIDSLASNMGTTTAGSTSFSNMSVGVTAYFNSTTLRPPDVNCWVAAVANGIPTTGLALNSTATFKAYIDMGFPVGVYCSSSNVVTPGYWNGITGAHMMCGIGYSFGPNGNFVTCYTCSVGDGAVSFPLTSTGLSNHAWYVLRWVVIP